MSDPAAKPVPQQGPREVRETGVVHQSPETRRRLNRPPVWWLAMLVALLAVGGYAVARQTTSGKSDPADAKKPGTEAKKPSTKPAPDAEKKVPENPFPRRFKAPSLEGGDGWLNASGEITMKDLRGKIVILDFWTYCCINCMHVLPDLKYLEKKYPNELVVIGVHSAKFDNEKDSENIRGAVLRHEIEHPVVNDSKMTIWRKFGASAWPTLVMIDPEGNYCGYVSGEGNRELLDIVMKKLITYHKAKGTLDETPVRFDLERNKLKAQPLRFPGKVLADEKNNRLFIADSNHNRIVVATLDGKLLDVVGTGAMGQKDGGFAAATLDHPQGMALAGDTLYVADTENHLIRAIDLKKKTVSTLAGTGEQARRRHLGGKLRDIPLNSPWTLTHVDGVLYICMAGPHQIWSHKLGSDRIEVFSGTGREDVINGTHLESAYAQPSGIATDGKHLFIADSEGSAIRQVEIDPKGSVTTVAGASDLPRGRTLFEFGDKDGLGEAARLQHPLGVTYADETLYVADTFNHKIRKIKLTKKGGSVSTWLGNGKRGNGLKPAKFSEPSGVSIAGGKLYIADANNHRICVADLKTEVVTELNIAGLNPPKKPRDVEVTSLPAGNATPLKPLTVTAGKSLTVKFAITLPDDYKLNPDFPQRYTLRADGKPTLIDAKHLRGKPVADASGKSLTVTLPIAAAKGKGAYELALSFGYCRAGKGGVCRFKTLRWTLPLTAADKGGVSELTVKADVTTKPSSTTASSGLGQKP